MESYSKRLEKMEKQNPGGEGPITIGIAFVEPGCDRLKAPGDCEGCPKEKKGCEYKTAGPTFKIPGMKK